jgi:hypothetical protein
VERKMPRYYFDIDDGESLTEDDDGLLLADIEDVRKHAIAALPSLAEEVLPDGDRQRFSVTVRNERGVPIFRASLSLSSEWLESAEEDTSTPQTKSAPAAAHDEH